MYRRSVRDGSEALEAVFRPVRRHTAFDETLERLGTAICLGVLAPGSQLPPERDLARQLTINRTTLRQAIDTLVQSGHLVSVRGGGGGTFVSQAPPLSLGRRSTPPRADVSAVLDQRVAIEIGATVLATERAEPAEQDALREPVAQMAAAQTFEDYRRADVRLHIAVAEAAHSPRLIAAMTDIHGRLSDLLAHTPHIEERLTHSNDQHDRLVALLRQPDSSRAVRLMREHIEQTENILTDT